MKTISYWFDWLGEAMGHALGSARDRRLEPPPIGPQPYRDVPEKQLRTY